MFANHAEYCTSINRIMDVHKQGINSKSASIFSHRGSFSVLVDNLPIIAKLMTATRIS